MTPSADNLLNSCSLDSCHKNRPKFVDLITMSKFSMLSASPSVHSSLLCNTGTVKAIAYYSFHPSTYKRFYKLGSMTVALHSMSGTSKFSFSPGVNIILIGERCSTPVRHLW